MSASTAYLLVSHGSRDPRPGQGMERLAQFVRSHESGLWGSRPGSQPRPDSRIERSRRSMAGRSADSQAASFLLRAPMLDWLHPTTAHFAGEESGIFRSRVSQPETVSGPLVGTACLEVGAVPLHQQIVAFSQRAQAAGVGRVQVIPLFLLAGVHVMEDIPAEVELAREALPGLPLEVCQHLGSHPGLKELLRHKLRTTATESLIVISHGSRRPGGNGPVCALAQGLGGTAAFWAVAPSLDTQVIQCIQSGIQRVAILPYFLFAGSTTDAITHHTEELAERFPQMGFHLLPPLGPSPELARLVVDLALGRVLTKPQPSLFPAQRAAFRHAVYQSSMVS
ncbi:sirohydrochlorin chelatase [Leptolyngbya sp. CCNP1308]|uniref:sirohydrochlorin chelatase n=1 Tax=Leptolyngbya sp. CCNP1308 TaxID=3110255 RepID=UPI002B2075A4|nr:sirohydrochlorin chelatase [Leptolyngbya sp. CCNP1308]MEA5452017.1 sirohydrochlorin chelatase [Leptolyngbya sp. CCNP1308]